MSEENHEQIEGTTGEGNPDGAGQPASQDPPPPPAPPAEGSGKTRYAVLWAKALEGDEEQLVWREVFPDKQIEAHSPTRAKEIAIDQADEVTAAKLRSAAEGPGLMLRAIATRSWEVDLQPTTLVVPAPEWSIH